MRDLLRGYVVKLQMLLLIALGGAGGAVSRYLLGTTVHALWDMRFPIGTLAVNLLGSAAIGVVYVLLERGLLHPDWRSVLMVGFLGAFTTFSTFSLDTLHLFEAGRHGAAVLYASLSFALCIAGVAAAVALTRSFS